MSFALGDIIVDRIQFGWAEKFDGTPIYVLTQLSEGSLEITAESKDAVDKDGTLIKRFWNGKTGTFTATNAMINLSMLASNSGVDPEVVSDGVIKSTGNNGTLKMPKIITVESGREYTLTGIQEGTLKCAVLNPNGSMGDTMTAGANSTATTYVLTGTSFTAPTIAGAQFIVKYTRTVENGAIVHNSADKFPATIRLYLKCLAVDPCEADTLKAMYLELPSFQPSPEITVGLQTDTTLDYSGDLQVDKITKVLQNVA